ncbi:MAG: helix-turn-helix domain-containing protein [Mangrovibacterium sp.]
MNPYVIPGIKKLDDLIDDLIADAFGVTVDQMKSPGRKRSGTEARQFAMWYRKKYTGGSTTVIGKYYGRDHATVFAAGKVVDNLMETDKVFKTKVERALMVLDLLKTNT